jgi:hypothetical protein
MILDNQTAACEAAIMADNVINQKFGSRKFAADSEAGHLWQLVFETSLKVLLSQAVRT